MNRLGLALQQQDARPAELAGMARFDINICKRNSALNAATIESARSIQQQGSRSARWIAADALRELTSAAVFCRINLTRSIWR